MYLNEYNKVKCSTITAGFDVGVTDMIKVHRVMKKLIRAGNLTNGIKVFNHVCNKIELLSIEYKNNDVSFGEYITFTMYVPTFFVCVNDYCKIATIELIEI